MITTIQRLKEENERLNHRAGHDWLTGLYDREAAEEKINRLIQERGCGVMILLDVDRFRRINSRYGHIVGDHVLSSIDAVLDSTTWWAGWTTMNLWCLCRSIRTKNFCSSAAARYGSV